MRSGWLSEAENLRWSIWFYDLSMEGSTLEKGGFVLGCLSNWKSIFSKTKKEFVSLGEMEMKQERGLA